MGGNSGDNNDKLLQSQQSWRTSEWNEEARELAGGDRFQKYCPRCQLKGIRFSLYENEKLYNFKDENGKLCKMNLVSLV